VPIASTPAIAFKRTKKKLLATIIATLLCSPNPNMTRKSGRMAIFGIA